jgi:hypothetical protein
VGVIGTAGFPDVECRVHLIWLTRAPSPTMWLFHIGCEGDQIDFPPRGSQLMDPPTTPLSEARGVTHPSFNRMREWRS